MQVEPMKPVLKAPGTKRLKLNHDEPLLNFAFNFNLRRYSQGARRRGRLPAVRGGGGGGQCAGGSGRAARCRPR